MKSCWSSIAIGIAWCLAWGDKREPQFEIGVLQEMRRALNSGEEVPARCEGNCRSGSGTSRYSRKDFQRRVSRNNY